MGLHGHLYMGPYFECTEKPATRNQPVYGCTNTKCPRHPRKVQRDAEGNFCQECGTINGKIGITVVDHVSSYDVVDDALHPLTWEGEKKGMPVLLGPNSSRPGDPKHPVEEGEPFHLDLRAVDMNSEMEWLKKAFAPELKKLEQAYATVEVKWGIHQYFS